MELLPPTVRAKIPPLYATENEEDPTVWVKFFDPFSQWTWYVIEFDGHDLCYGYVIGNVSELGYFRLVDLAHLRPPEADRFHASVGIERDEQFEPCPLSLVYPFH